jgi:NAD-dependent SIR2 family protein deacetylase
VIVGTSMQVYPANTIPYFVEEHARIIVIDPEEIKVDFDDDFECYHIKEKATSGMKELYESLMKNK